MNNSYDVNNIFARILRSEIPCNKILENEFALAFSDINPQAPIHTLIIPKNPYINFYDFTKNASIEELTELLGRGRAKKGMFEGDLQNGELEIGQIAGIMNELLPAQQIILDLVKEFNKAKTELTKISLDQND